MVTKKGTGYSYAQADPAKFHGIGKFDPETGKKLSPKIKTFSDSFGEVMVELADKNEKVCAITAAMPGGTGLLGFQKKYPNRTFDVGIAEEHAVSMAGGLAKQGMIPVVALYSTFLQRSFDQIIQDIALLHLHVVFAIDRAGLVGDDGPTHHGVFDVGFLSQVPGMLVLNPVSFAEQQEMLRWAVEEYDGPVAIRYPRGTEGTVKDSFWTGLKDSCVCHRQGKDIALVTYGTMLETSLQAAECLSSQGIEACVLRLLSPSCFNAGQILSYIPENTPILVVEEVCAGSGIKEKLAWEIRKDRPAQRMEGLDLGKEFVTHGSQQKLYEQCGVDGNAIAKFVKEILS